MDRLFILRNRVNGSALVKEYAPHQSLGTIVLLQPRRCAGGRGGRTKFRVRPLICGFGEHKEQLQHSELCPSRRCVAISARRRAQAQR